MPLLHSLLNYVDYIPSLPASLNCGVKGSIWGAEGSVVVQDSEKQETWKNTQLVRSSGFILGVSHCQHVPLGKKKDLLMDKIN